MLKKPEHTPRKSPRLVEAGSTVGIEPLTFNILTQTPPPNKNATPAKKKGQKRKGKMVEPPYDTDSDFVREKNIKKIKISTNVETGQSSKPSKRRATMKEASEIPISKKGKKNG
ncbi:hypothetical protein R3W88_019631 [Solanum pinnatisectum]|uniref:Uncharacterized protein n=1 Tax=Solanum pinnatisectum TaxID=50273 RepID=A0AAV9KK67_9SOLN|nr:hypothetical protein R3W88_019631 [Solanum pinnatisectum]